MKTFTYTQTQPGTQQQTLLLYSLCGFKLKVISLCPRVLLFVDFCVDFVYAFIIPGWCSTPFPRRAGEIPDLWRPQEKTVCLPPHHRTPVCYLGNQQQSLMGSGGRFTIYRSKTATQAVTFPYPSNWELCGKYVILVILVALGGSTWSMPRGSWILEQSFPIQTPSNRTLPGSRGEIHARCMPCAITIELNFIRSSQSWWRYGHETLDW